MCVLTRDSFGVLTRDSFDVFFFFLILIKRQFRCFNQETVSVCFGAFKQEIVSVFYSRDIFSV